MSDNITGCHFVNVSCNSFVDICHDAHCDPQKNVTDQCVVTDVVCPHPADNNCTNTQCFLKVQDSTCRRNPDDINPNFGVDTDDQTVPLCHSGGCEVQALSCASFGALAGGLAAGAIGGIAAAGAIIAGAALVGGAAAAAATQTGEGQDSPVNINPMFEAATQGSAGLSS